MRKISTIILIVVYINMTFAQTFSSSPGANITNDGQHCYPITVSGIGTINNVYQLQSICIDITHTYDADLDIYLNAPDGTSIELTTDNGSNGDNYEGTCFTIDAMDNVTSGSAPFPNSYLAEGNLNSVNNGQDADGTWNLCIEDDEAGEDGTLNSWMLSFGTGCKWSMELVDTFGDGWTDGGHIEIIVNGFNTGNAYVYSGDGIRNGTNIKFDLDVNDGDNVQINFVSGSYDDDDEYYIYDQNGNLIHSEGVGNGVLPNNYSFTVSSCSKPQYTTSDCEGAIKVCTGSYSYSNSAYGDGKYEEIAGRGTCYGGTILYGETIVEKGEVNSTWYVFEVETSGDLEFSVNQNVSSDDYDWVLFDLTNNTCDDIVNGNISSVECNWDISSSSTGMSSSTSGSGWETERSVTIGEKYALVIDNWSTGGSGYTLNLNDGSAVIYDNVPPELDQITSAIADTVWFDFSEEVSCSSVSTSDFSLDGPNAPYTILDVGSYECDAGATISEHYWIKISPNVTDGANHTLSLVGDVDDKCTNPTNHNDDDFLPVTLVSYDYNCYEDYAELTWITETEINNDYFSIYKSTNGGKWEFVTSIIGAGNSNLVNKYNYRVENTDGNIYYKLTQTDFDNTQTELGIKYGSCSQFIPEQEISLMPNPATANSIVKIDGEYIKAEIYDMLGKKVNIEITNNQIIGLSKGVYFIKLDDNKPIKLIIQ